MATTYQVGIIAKLLDLTPRRVQMLVKDGVIPQATKGQYDLVGSVQGYIKYLKKIAEGQGGPSLMEERRLKVQVDRKLKELEYLLETRELIRRDEVLNEFIWRVNAVKQGLWSLHRRLPMELVGKDVREMTDILKKYEHELLERFSRQSGVLKNVAREKRGNLVVAGRS